MPLTLSPGPKLTRYDWGYDESLDKNASIGHDVTAQASHHLFDVVKLDADVTLRDIFLLLDTDTLLQEVYAREWVKECLAEVMRGRSTDVPAIEYDPEGIEYLELYQVWSQDSYTQELQPIHHLQFHGIGFVLQEDVVEEGHVSYRAGQRIKWGVSCTSPLKLLHLPVRINPEVIIREDNVDSVNYGDTIGRMLNPSVTLGQVLHGVLWELSFHGAPSARNEVSAKLKSLASDIGSETLISHQTTDLFADYKATFVSCFIDTANCAPDDLFDVLEQIGDQDHAEMVLRDKLHADIRLKPAFSGMTGMELRRYVRENSDITF